MNEAFSDPSVLGDFTTNEDYMPFVHSLLDGADNTISGHLNVSVKGGNTANTEFEYLTGASMAFLPYGSIPYQQYVKKETPSMAPIFPPSATTRLRCTRTAPPAGTEISFIPSSASTRCTFRSFSQILACAQICQ